MDFREQNQMTDALTSAIQIISAHNTTKKEATIIITAEIKNILDSSNGKYEVQYLDNKFEVFSFCNQLQYNVGDLVYVIIPNGDFNTKKIILSNFTTPVNLFLDVDKIKVIDNNIEYNFKEYLKNLITEMIVSN